MYKLKKQEEKHRLFSYLLITGVVITTFVTITVMTVYIYFDYPKIKIISSAVFPLFMYPFSYLVFRLSRKGKIKAGLKIYIIGTSILIMIAVFLFRGAFSASNNLFIWVVLVSGTLIKPKYALYSSIFFILYVIILSIFQYSGLYTPISTNPDRISLILNISYNEIVMLFAVGYLTYLNMSFLNKTRTELEYNASHDSLTGLLNRAGLKEVLISHLEKANNNKVALLFIDLDNFKEINDRLGHEAGDKLLIEVAKRLENYSKDKEKVKIARFGGDEFILIIEYNQPIKELKKIIKNEMLEIFNIPYTVNKHEFEISASIGVSIYPDNSSTIKELITNADIAMYKSKKEGKKRVEYYSIDLKNRITQKIDIKNNLRKAITKNELILYYQPQTDLKTDKIIGMEALVRWKPNNKIIYPDEFISIAEESGLIIDIGDWIFKKACEDLKIWQDKNENLSVSVNMSSIQFQQPNIVEKIKHTIKETGVNTKFLELEITETGLMEQNESIINKIGELKALGIKISIDDFGTGYSSLAYLKKFNVDKVKIDKSFIWKLEENEDDKPIIKAIIAMSQNLNLEVLAEGVETKYQKDFLKENGCKLYQGYYCSKPVSRKDFNKLLLEQEGA